MAGNHLTSAPKDGHVLALLESDPAIGRVIQGYTPYQWDELAPVAVAWREIQALVVPAEKDWEALIKRRPGVGKPRLACQELEPVSDGVLMAIEAAKRAGFDWELTLVGRLDPAKLLEDQADAMVVPLGRLASHPQADRLKVALVFTNRQDLPCVAEHPTLSYRGLDITSSPPVAFYLPAGVNSAIKRRINLALNEVLSEKRNEIEGRCLELISRDYDSTLSFMDEQYRLQEEMLKRLGFPEAEAF